MDYKREEEAEKIFSMISEEVNGIVISFLKKHEDKLKAHDIATILAALTNDRLDKFLKHCRVEKRYEHCVELVKERLERFFY